MEPGSRPGIRNEPEDLIGRHVRAAHAAFKGEHQLAEYVSSLEIEECVRILSADPNGLVRLAARRDVCRVGPQESRSFEDVIRTWALYVLSGAEGG